MKHLPALFLVAAVVLGILSGSQAVAAPAADCPVIRADTTGTIPWPPPPDPNDPTGDTGTDDDSSSDDHDSDSGSDSGDSSYPDNPYDPANEPMPN